MTTVSSPALLHPHDAEPVHASCTSFIKRYIFSTDHKIIGIQFLFVGLFFFLVGGLLAMLIRWQLMYPNPSVPGFRPVPLLADKLGWTANGAPGVMPPEFYNMTFTMHATIMIFLVIIPLLVGAFGNYLVPLKIGARDMAFPFLNGLAFWWSLPAGAIIIAGFSGAMSGWTSYPPLSSAPELSRLYPSWAAIPVWGLWVSLFLLGLFCCAYCFPIRNRVARATVAILIAGLGATAITPLVLRAAPNGQAAWFFGLLWLGFGSLLGAINYITTVLKHRCPGMTMFRMPLSVWGIFVTSIIVLLATPVLASAMVMNLLDHHGLTSFFKPFDWTISNQIQANAGGGYALLHQHLFWFYSHPAVYIMILPAMGMISDILPVFARKPVFGYRPMVYAMAVIAFLGFVVWAHHMFQSGMNPTLATGFALTTMLIAVPSAIKTFNWLGTIWRGNIRLTTPMLNALAFVSMFVVGGLSGIFMASQAVDVHIHDTYFIVAHIHYVLFGGSTFGVFAAIYFWYPKMFGRMMSEPLGKIHFALSFIAFNCVFFPMHILGIRGFPRRYADYTTFDSWSDLVDMNKFISIAAFGLMLAQVPFIINFFGSWIWGQRAGNNPWEATTLEWNETTSPPPHGNFASTPVVYHGPYEYSNPLIEDDWLPQTRRLET